MFEKERRWADFNGNRFDGRIDFKVSQDMLKHAFELQNEEIGVYEDQLSEGFQVELKRFFSQGQRRKFRSTILARVLVETAIETGKFINYVDHHSIFDDETSSKRHIRELIKKYLDDLKYKHNVDFFVNIDNYNGIKISIDPRSIERYKRTRLEENPIKLFRREDVTILDHNVLLDRQRQLKLMILL